MRMSSYLGGAGYHTIPGRDITFFIARNTKYHRFFYNFTATLLKARIPTQQLSILVTIAKLKCKLEGFVISYPPIYPVLKRFCKFSNRFWET